MLTLVLYSLLISRVKVLICEFCSMLNYILAGNQSTLFNCKIFKVKIFMIFQKSMKSVKILSFKLMYVGYYSIISSLYY